MNFGKIHLAYEFNEENSKATWAYKIPRRVSSPLGKISCLGHNWLIHFKGSCAYLFHTYTSNTPSGESVSTHTLGIEWPKRYQSRNRPSERLFPLCLSIKDLWARRSLRRANFSPLFLVNGGKSEYTRSHSYSAATLSLQSRLRFLLGGLVSILLELDRDQMERTQVN